MRFLTLFFIGVTSLSVAQEQYFPGSVYDPSTPTPQSVLGYAPGERFSDFRNLERYFSALVQSSSRIRRIEYGRTYENRPLQVFVISSPRNLARLDQIKSDNLVLVNPSAPNRQSRKGEILKTLPAIVWLSYGVHGNESSSPEAAMMTAYQLCAGTDNRTTTILDNLVVLLDPSVNPDGHERYVEWVNSKLGRNVDVNPDALEHDEPWPGGRGNHYYFDLNRDWSWATQIETRSRLDLYRRWMPHVHVDFHEMGYTSTYFFFPATEPFHTQFPEEVKKWGTIYGKGNAEAFDKFGIPYYTAESFDLLYPGYGDSWPTFNGAVGMTYEQAGHSAAGLGIRKPNGEVLTLRERLRNHFIAGMATLETTVAHKQERLADFASFWESGPMRSGPVRSYIFRATPDPVMASRLAGLLLRQGIRVHRLEQGTPLTVKKFFSRKSSKEAFPAGTYVVSLDQANRRLATALLEPATALQDTFFYDVSAWSLPVAYGLTAYTSESGLPSGAKELVEAPSIEGSINGRATYAYLIPWQRSTTASFLWELLEKGYRLSYTTRPVNLPDRTFRSGTIVAFVRSNPDSLHVHIRELSQQFGADVVATNTGLTQTGIDLGSNHVRPLFKPRIAVLTEESVDPTDFGELWFMFDREYDIPFTALRTSQLGSARLEQFSVLILPNARDYRSLLDSTDIGKLKRWVSEGGVVIGIEGGARFLTKKQSGLTAALLETDRKDSDKSKEEKEEENVRKEELKHQSLVEKEEADRRRRIPGTIFRALIDTTHPIGFGSERDAYVFRGNGPSFLLNESANTVVRFATDTTSASGYVPAGRGKRIADSGYILDFRVGRGRAILFAENVTFRMFWKGHQKFLLNAIFFLPQRN